jgi:hypothetical protein
MGNLDLAAVSGQVAPVSGFRQYLPDAVVQNIYAFNCKFQNQLIRNCIPPKKIFSFFRNDRYRKSSLDH